MDFKGRALVIRLIPYSDQAIIVKCLTDNNGLVTFFTRKTKSQKGTTPLLSGSFITFDASLKNSKLPTLTQHAWDSDIPPAALSREAIPVWLFTLELLSKSVPDNFQIPELKRTVETYYVHLLHDAISSHAIIPMILLTTVMGLSDPQKITVYDSKIRTDLLLLGMEISADNFNNDGALFTNLLTRFTSHFEIQTVESLEIL